MEWREGVKIMAQGRKSTRKRRNCRRNLEQKPGCRWWDRNTDQNDKPCNLALRHVVQDPGQCTTNLDGFWPKFFNGWGTKLRNIFETSGSLDLGGVCLASSMRTRTRNDLRFKSFAPMEDFGKASLRCHPNIFLTPLEKLCAFFRIMRPGSCNTRLSLDNAEPRV